MNFKELMDSVDPKETSHLLIINGCIYLKTRNEETRDQKTQRFKVDAETGELTPFIPENVKNDERRIFARAGLKAAISPSVLASMLKVTNGTMSNDMMLITKQGK